MLTKETPETFYIGKIPVHIPAFCPLKLTQDVGRWGKGILVSVMLGQCCGGV